VKRTQIYLEAEQTQRLDRTASANGMTRSELIRDAVDDYLARHEEEDETARLARFKRAVHDTAGIAPHLPSGKQYVEELREADRRRDDELERRWRG